MVSVTNADPERIYRLLEEFSQDVRTVLPPVLSIRNGRRSVVITGTPEQLGRFELYCKQISEKEEADRKNKVRGGDVFSPVFDPVEVEVGFHTPGSPTASTSSAAGRRRSASTSGWPALWPSPFWYSRSTGWTRSSGSTRQALDGFSTWDPGRC